LSNGPLLSRQRVNDGSDRAVRMSGGNGSL
jgi:hypothetical protein